MCAAERDPTAPFRRRDRYGDAGLAIGLLDTLKLAVGALLWLPLKVVGIAFCVVACYCVWQLPLLPLQPRVWLSRGLCRLCLFFIGFSITVVEARPGAAASTQPLGLVCNHVSYIDILVLMVSLPRAPQAAASKRARAPSCSQPLIALVHAGGVLPQLCRAARHGDHPLGRPREVLLPRGRRCSGRAAPRCRLRSARADSMKMQCVYVDRETLSAGKEVQASVSALQSELAGLHPLHPIVTACRGARNKQGCVVALSAAVLLQGAAAQVRARMARAAQGQALGERPMLLFPEVRACTCPLSQRTYSGAARPGAESARPMQGTTTNGRYLLPFKTGAG